MSPTDSAGFGHYYDGWSREWPPVIVNHPANVRSFFGFDGAVWEHIDGGDEFPWRAMFRGGGE